MNEINHSNPANEFVRWGELNEILFNIKKNDQSLAGDSDGDGDYIPENVYPIADGEGGLLPGNIKGLILEYLSGTHPVDFRGICVGKAIATDSGLTISGEYEGLTGYNGYFRKIIVGTAETGVEYSGKVRSTGRVGYSDEDKIIIDLIPISDGVSPIAVRPATYIVKVTALGMLRTNSDPYTANEAIKVEFSGVYYLYAGTTGVGLVTNEYVPGHVTAVNTELTSGNVALVDTETWVNGWGYSNDLLSNPRYIAPFLTLSMYNTVEASWTVVFDIIKVSVPSVV